MQAIWIGGKTAYTGQWQTQIPMVDLAVLEEDFQSSQNVDVYLYPGDALLRPDFLQIQKMAQSYQKNVYLRTSGQILLKADYAKLLQHSSIKGIVVVIPSFRKEMNQWLLGTGWLKIATQAILQSIKMGFEVRVEIPFLRVNLDFIEESLLALKQLGVRNFLLRFPDPDEFVVNTMVQLMPRYGLLPDILSKISQWEDQYNIRCQIMNIPKCITKKATVIEHTKQRQCSDCRDSCTGISQSYLSCFGWSEFRTVSANLQQASELNLWLDTQFSSRALRQRMVQIANEKPKIVTVVGNFTHPHLYELLRDVQRLSIECIQYSGDLFPLLLLSDTQRLRLKPTCLAQHVVDLSSLDMQVPKWSELFSSFSSAKYVLIFHVRNIQDVLDVQNWVMNGMCMAEIELYFEADGSWQDLDALFAQLQPIILQKLLKVLPYCWHQKVVGTSLFSNWSGYEEQPNNGEEFWMYRPSKPCPKRDSCQAQSICVGYIEGKHSPKIVALDKI